MTTNNKINYGFYTIRTIFNLNNGTHMPSKTRSATERLASIEVQKQQLIKKRQSELASIIVRQNSLTIDDHLLTGFLIFAADPENKNHPTLLQFKELAKSRKSPSNSKSSNQKPTQTNH
ncbi:hypothetical protein [Candidatus Tisiphia endosymbiont of Beris chalybata]|uniref:hypothetical protein n=1 Tax=Candidatus Tisiphia endosymbiont of Beris chalybata TaxID=3066262 RepID=UPI00312C960C